MTRLAYLDQPCERCGSKRKVAKRWTERIPTYTGTAKVEYTQIVCTNKACQEAFDETLAKEEKKRKTQQQEKAKRDEERKSQSLLAAAKSRKKN